MLTRKEAEAKLHELLKQMQEVVKSCDVWNNLPEDDKMLCAGLTDFSAWAFVMDGSREEVLSVDVRGT